jgi:two-component system sensor histidine kinase KdpD
MDFPWLVKALVHVMDNAIRYSPAGTPIQVRARARGECLEITVADRGVGMSPEDLTRVFEKFYRVGRAEEATGTGVGLAICKAILTGHGGSIRADERKGGGTIITMTLPL